MQDISDYDQSGYDYTKYWTFRQYEDKIEQIALGKLLPQHGTAILDLGGSFGRLMPVYAPRFTKATILDYSATALAQAQDRAKKLGFSNLTTVKGDGYQLPFPDASFDTVIVIRVLHHIENTTDFFHEINRVLKPNGILILDVPNKIHLKTQIQKVLRGDLSFMHDLSPVNRATITTGTTRGIFYNFHPKQIKNELNALGFSINRSISVSNLRLPSKIKQVLPIGLLVWTDLIIAPLFSWLSWGPQIWLRCQKSAT